MFSVLNRKEEIQKLKNTPLDLIIIGGGITGAGIALDAASRGMKVALLEKNDFASGTSGKSTKLIHGGLRYLKQLEFGLVKEVGLERAIVHKNAKHLVIAEQMMLPIIKNGSLNKFFTNIALMVYDFLAGVAKSETRRMLTKPETIKEEPLLHARGKNLIAGALYYEYRTDDARLTIEVIKKAQQFGAMCFNYAEVESFIYANEKVRGVKVKDNIIDSSFEINASTIVNATGPWTDVLRNADKSLEGKRLLLTKGVHIVFDNNKFPIKHSIYFDMPDKRMIFAISRNNKTYVGTTDTVYNKEISNPQVNLEDVEYLLNGVNKMFPSIKLNKKHIESSWAGLRPLIYEDGKAASEVSRKDEIFISPSNLISIAGGKLTGYRKMAEKTVDLVRLKLKEENKIFSECKTENIKIAGADFNNNEEITDLIIQLTGEAKQVNIGLENIKEWVYRYGTNAKILLEIAYNNFRYVEKDVEKLIILTELIYVIENESVATIADFYIRRTSKLYFDRKNIEKHLDFICLELSARLKLNKEKTENQKETFLAYYNESLNFIN
ncbi:MAG: glycerol-3-phosphate dehydrogenase/oxidase [Chitinophagales bacterium]